MRLARKKMVKVAAGSLVLSRGGRFLIRRRPAGEIMGGLWEFPEWKLAREKTLSRAHVRQRVLEEAKKELGIEPEGLKHLGAVKRNYTHHLETLEVFVSELRAAEKVGLQNGWPHAWVTQKELARYPFSSAHAKIAELIRPS